MTKNERKNDDKVRNKRFSNSFGRKMMCMSKIYDLKAPLKGCTVKIYRKVG